MSDYIRASYKDPIKSGKYVVIGEEGNIEPKKEAYYDTELKKWDCKVYWWLDKDNDIPKLYGPE